jgi:hypothetical protein
MQGNPNVIDIAESTVRQGSTLSARLNRKNRLAVNPAAFGGASLGYYFRR